MSVQPTRRRDREDRRFDKTQLKESHHGKLVHRDYAAHFFRWAFAARQLKPTDYVLDVGCGQDQPLAMVMTQRHGSERERYYGVDLNHIEKKRMFAWATIVDEFNFIEQHKELIIGNPTSRSVLENNQVDGFDKIICFEVIEHMEVDDGKRLLDAFQDVIISGGTLYLSTPVFNGYKAANHIHEYTIPELQAAIEAAGFVVERRVGTFANIKDIERVASPMELEAMRSIGWWFSNEVLSVMFACNHPDQSRNNLWICRPKD